MNGYESAFPSPYQEVPYGDGSLQAEFGLTKREHFAALAMQGLLPTATVFSGADYMPMAAIQSCAARESAAVARAAVAYADALIAELEKPR